jgi:pantoate--beta-alanine ligase
MKVFDKIDEFKEYRCRIDCKKTVGFVPTMGDIHQGHLSLIRRSKEENDMTIVSIFVNPEQFDRKKDYKQYYRNLPVDLEKLEIENIDAVFVPTSFEMYPEKFQTRVNVENLSKPLCGAFRPGHFRGVATVVLKLLNLVQPARLYLGMKDYQQWKVVEQMVKDLNVPVEVVPCPLVRECDNLAMSSRNRRLNPKQRARAPRIFYALLAVADFIKEKRKVSKLQILSQFKKILALSPEDKLEYLEVVDPETLLPLKKFRPPALIATALWIGKTRLIDNLLIPGFPPERE